MQVVDATLESKLFIFLWSKQGLSERKSGYGSSHFSHTLTQKIHDLIYDIVPFFLSIEIVEKKKKKLLYSLSNWKAEH